MKIKTFFLIYGIHLLVAPVVFDYLSIGHQLLSIFFVVFGALPFLAMFGNKNLTLDSSIFDIDLVP